MRAIALLTSTQFDLRPSEFSRRAAWIAIRPADHGCTGSARRGWRERPADSPAFFVFDRLETAAFGRGTAGKGTTLQVIVRDNNIEQAIRVLKKKMQREGVFREMKARSAYEKPSERRAREKAEGIRRARK